MAHAEFITFTDVERDFDFECGAYKNIGVTSSSRAVVWNCHTFYGCQVSDFACICTRERHFIDEYIIKVAPCIANQSKSFMEAFEDVCAQWKNPITSLPTEIGTWVMSSFLTKYPSLATSSSSVPGSTTPATNVPTPSDPLITPIPAVPTEKPKTGLKIGIGVGVATVAMLIIGGIISIWIHRRHMPTETNKEGDDTSMPSVSYHDEKKKSEVLDHTVIAELEGDGRAEMWSPPPDIRASVMSELQGDLESSTEPVSLWSSRIDARMSAVSELGDNTRNQENRS
ncbi:hypothetical protein N0V90_002221 [Kalmusia sp. IMI 367209]|nr:hypothetical protein N0V90_002221 [Kalmusia sp. IMI 367209]